MAAIDLFKPAGGRDSPENLAVHGWDQPASIFQTVTPNDSTDLTYVTRGLYIGGAGNVGVYDIAGNYYLFRGVPAGTILPIRVSRVLLTQPGSPATAATTATHIIALV
jgi:hypothetical protein